MDIGFVGVGSMGAAMIPNLVKAGHQVSVWNRSAAALSSLDGVAVLPSPQAAFTKEVVVTMLSDDVAIRSVIIDSGAITSARKGSVHVMMATISPALVEELKTLHAASGIAYVAAPVMGVPAVAAQAQLNILAAGDPVDVATVQPLFDALGRNTVFASPSYQRYGGYIATDTYEPGFKLTLGLKDVTLALDAAAAKDAALPATSIVRDMMAAAVDQGFGAKDWSILAKVTRQKAGLGEKA